MASEPSPRICGGTRGFGKEMTKQTNDNRSKGTKTKDAAQRTGLPFVASVHTSFAPMASVRPVKSQASFFCASMRP